MCRQATEGATMLCSLVGFSESKGTHYFYCCKKIYAKNYKKKTVVRGDNLTTVLVIQTASIVTFAWQGCYLCAVRVVQLCCNEVFATR